MTFWNQGTFVRTAHVQEVGVLLKWNNSKSFGKGLPYVCNLLFLTTKFDFQNQSPKCRVDGYKFHSVYYLGSEQQRCWSDCTDQTALLLFAYDINRFCSWHGSYMRKLQRATTLVLLSACIHALERSLIIREIGKVSFLMTCLILLLTFCGNLISSISQKMAEISRTQNWQFTVPFPCACRFLTMIYLGSSQYLFHVLVGFRQWFILAVHSTFSMCL